MDLNCKIVVDHGKEAEQKYWNNFDVMTTYYYIINIYRYTYNSCLIILPYFSGWFVCFQASKLLDTPPTLF